MNRDIIDEEIGKGFDVWTNTNLFFGTAKFVGFFFKFRTNEQTRETTDRSRLKRPWSVVHGKM